MTALFLNARAWIRASGAVGDCSRGGPRDALVSQISRRENGAEEICNLLVPHADELWVPPLGRFTRLSK